MMTRINQRFVHAAKSPQSLAAACDATAPDLLVSRSDVGVNCPRCRDILAARATSSTQQILLPFPELDPHNPRTKLVKLAYPGVDPITSALADELARGRS